MLHAAELPKNLWGEALKHAVWLKNRTLTRSLDGKTPYKMLHGEKPNLRDLHKFGCKVWVHDADGSKLDGRARVGHWLGFDGDSSGHRIYWPDNRSIAVERSVKFDNSVEVQLPHTVLNEGEKGKESIQQTSGVQNAQNTPSTPSATSSSPPAPSIPSTTAPIPSTSASS